MDSLFELRRAGWVVDLPEEPPVAWLREQVRTITMNLCGTRPRFSDTPGAGRRPTIIVAIEDRLTGDDYRIAVHDSPGGAQLHITGAHARAASYGVFDLFETMGCRFLISGDLCPDTIRGVAVPRIEKTGHTDAGWRGIWFQYCFATNSIMSLCDYEAMFDQMAKMRLNRIVFYHFENEPFIDYTFRGERKLVGDVSHPTSGYISYGRTFSGSYLVDDIPIGRELFGRSRVAPMELQAVASSAEALDASGDLMRKIMAAATQRGIRCWTSFLPQFLPMNLAKYARPMGRPHLHWSGLVSATDPVIDEVNRVRIRAITESYPDLEGIFLGIPEGYYEDPYPESAALLEAERPKYARALELHKKLWGAYWNHNEQLLEDHMDRDIGFTEVLKRAVDIAREVAPELRLGVICVCKAYLLTKLHRDLHTDICFADIESRSLWTIDGAPLHLFDEMADRECMIIPRAVDDGSMAGLQFNLNLYDQDGFIRSAAEHSTSGLIIQTTHIRGNEHNMGYLAAGMWDPRLTPGRFYEDYAGVLVGEAAAPSLLRAFNILEENEQFLGGRGQSNMGWNKVPPMIEVLRRFRDFATPFHAAPYDQGFVEGARKRSVMYEQAVEHLTTAAAELDTAAGLASGPGRTEVRYLIERNAGYLHHLRSLVILTDVYAEVLDSFDLLQNDMAAFRTRLAAARTHAGEAHQEACTSASHFSSCVEHPTDLGVLWMINTSMVIGTRVLEQYLRNVAAYFDGEEYWEPVERDKLFGACPYPAHDLGSILVNGTLMYEPR